MADLKVSGDITGGGGVVKAPTGEFDNLNNIIADLTNTINSIDYVTGIGSNSNGWYRIWKSGWIEQGGHKDGGSNKISNTLINFPISFTKTDYQFLITCVYRNNPDGTDLWTSKTDKTISSIRIKSSSGDAYDCDWYACGN